MAISRTTRSPNSRSGARGIRTASARSHSRPPKWPRLEVLHSVDFGRRGPGQDFGRAKLSAFRPLTWTLRAAVFTSGELCVWVARNHRKRNLASEVSIFFQPHGKLSDSFKGYGTKIPYSEIPLRASDGMKIEPSPEPSVRLVRRRT